MSHKPQLVQIQTDASRLLAKFAGIEGVEKELALVKGTEDSDLVEIRTQVHNSVLAAEELYSKRSAAQSEKITSVREMEEDQKFQDSLKPANL